MKPRYALPAVFAGCGLLLANWPQAAGPEGNWRARGEAPVSWSVSLDQNIAWRTALPNGGQSGTSRCWGDRLFLTTFDEFHAGDSKFSGSILGHCLDARKVAKYFGL